MAALLAGAGLPAEGLADQFGPGYAVAAAGGRIVGAAGIEVHGGDGLLRSAVVAPEWRGRGVGRALTRDRIGWARGRGLRSLWLLTTTTPGFFERLGFVPADREDAPEAVRASAEFASICPSDAVVMTLPLEGSASRGAGDAADAAGQQDPGGALKERVRSRYGQAARQAASGAAASCCGASPQDVPARNPITSDLYAKADTSGLPVEAMLASLGCGNPTALASLAPGETVLDLGSGGGIDVLLSARRVGPTGKAYGLDMTDEMLDLARENQRRAGVENVEFLKGDIEAIPLPDASVDVIISNCVINLAADKGRVLREAFRVLRPGGRLAVSDIVVRGNVPAEIRRSMELWMGCVAGALEEGEYRRLLEGAGFEAVDLEPTRVYGREDVTALMEGGGLDGEGFAEAVDGRFMSAFVRARRPA